MHTISITEDWLDYPSKDDNAVAVIFTGCDHHCKGCHSPGLQIPYEYTESVDHLITRIVDFCKRANTNKLVITGGDCLFKTNLDYTKQIVNTLSPTYDICIYTGYSIEYVKQLGIKGPKFFKCGTYNEKISRESKKTDSIFILASPNQNFYDENYQLLSNDGILQL